MFKINRVYPVNFENPLFLTLFFVLLFILFIFKRKEIKISNVPSLDLWKVSSHTQKRKIYKNIELILILSIIISLIFSLSSPFSIKKEKKGIIIVDSSESMTIPFKKSRWEKANNIIKVFTHEFQDLLIFISSSFIPLDSQILFNYKSNLDELKKKYSKNDNCEETLELITNLKKTQDNIILITDGSDKKWLKFLKNKKNKSVIIENKVNNVGIKIEKAFYSLLEEKLSLIIKIINENNKDVSLILWYKYIYKEKVTKKSLKIFLKKCKFIKKFINIYVPYGAYFEIFIEDKKNNLINIDDFKNDNKCIIKVPFLEKINVGIISDKKEKFIYSALISFPFLVNIENIKYFSSFDNINKKNDYKIFIVCKNKIKNLLPNRNYIFFNTQFDNLNIIIKKRIKKNDISYKGDMQKYYDYILKYTDFSSLKILPFYYLGFKDKNYKVLLSLSNIPLIIKGKIENNINYLYINCDIKSSHFFYSYNFPILVYNFIKWSVLKDHSLIKDLTQKVIQFNDTPINNNNIKINIEKYKNYNYYLIPKYYQYFLIKSVLVMCLILLINLCINIARRIP